MKLSIYISVLLAAFLVAFTYTDTLKIKGKVTDDKGKALFGASVIVKGTTTGTSTRKNGEFVIEASKGAIFVVSALGFSSTEVTISDDKFLHIQLEKLTETLDEVVVTGSASQRRIAGVSVAGKGKRIRSAEMAYAAPQPYAPRFYKDYKKEESWRNNNDFNTEGYDKIEENRFLKTTDNPLSTFSIDVDAASYSNVRRMINDGSLPPAGAVRIEEMINYFSYNYPQPKGNDPFSVNTEIATCPWNTDHRLVSIGLQGRKISTENLPPSNLTFLIDVSGSMDEENKLPLVKSSLKLLVEQLREQDKVSIVVYAGNAGLVLEPTSGSNKMKIKNAIDNLEAGGSTAGGQGIKLAYKTAKQNLLKEGNNRVILCTDGDFNVGASSDDELERLIEEERKSGIFLTVLGYGTGNYQDAKMQKLADKGNGNHAYIDGVSEAKKVLVNEFGGTLFTIAKDVKLQIEFNPEKVQGYRLIGYENRMLAKEDFNNDKKDAGELGSGHTVTAIYEVVPVGVKSDVFDSVDKLKYQKEDKAKGSNAFAGELMNIKLRYKQPDGGVSKLLEHPIMDSKKSINEASENLRFAAAVAQFGMLLRDSKFKGNGSYNMVTELAKSAVGKDDGGYRKEFIELLSKARKLERNKDVARRDEEDN